MWGHMRISPPDVGSRNTARNFLSVPQCWGFATAPAPLIIRGRTRAAGRGPGGSHIPVGERTVQASSRAHQRQPSPAVSVFGPGPQEDRLNTMTGTGNAFTSGPPTPGIPVVTGVLLTLAHVFMSWRNAGYRFRLTRSLCGPGSKTMLPGAGK